MQRAMAAEQEAEREAQAKLAAAHGELNASINLKAASDIMKSNPIALQVNLLNFLLFKKLILLFMYVFNFFQLRYLQTLNSISIENNHTVIFPFPMNVMRKIMSHLLIKPFTGASEFYF